MAMVIAIQKWRLYQWGRHFVVHTDQRSLRFLADQRLTAFNERRAVVEFYAFWI